MIGQGYLLDDAMQRRLLTPAEAMRMKMQGRWRFTTWHGASTSRVKACRDLACFIYVAGGAGGPSAAAQRCLNWGGQRRTLPELTDDRRARLLRELVHSGRLPFGQPLGKNSIHTSLSSEVSRLYVVNAYAQTPLHCAASSGSSSMVQELLALVGSQATVVGVVDEAPDVSLDHLRACRRLSTCCELKIAVAIHLARQGERLEFF